ncbi:DsbA family protein [Undibacterium sp. SXout11W]|uniref:DsbA family protein n=1 Tax=Undibacterium sp. SXout11W TaxID=3413050 RepID=UPI003BEFEFFB
MPHFIYIADPMCSWCYGFGPELQALLDETPNASLEIIVGGLRAYNQEIMGESQRTTIREHWHHVAEASGLPFSDVGMTQVGFKYDTEPACRAIVAVKTIADHLSGQQFLEIFHAIQHAFYAQGLDVTQPAVLAEVVVTTLNKIDGHDSFDVDSFLETLLSPQCMSDVRDEFEQCQRWGIRGFPALLIVHNEALHMIAAGYTKTAELRAAMTQVVSS